MEIIRNFRKMKNLLDSSSAFVLMLMLLIILNLKKCLLGIFDEALLSREPQPDWNKTKCHWNKIRKIRCYFCAFRLLQIDKFLINEQMNKKRIPCFSIGGKSSPNNTPLSSLINSVWDRTLYKLRSLLLTAVESAFQFAVS